MCDCDKNPVRDVLAKSSLREVEAARDTALSRSQRARSEGDKAMSDVYKHVADECSAELADRMLAVMTRGVLSESQAATRQARELLNQSVNP